MNPGIFYLYEYNNTQKMRNVGFFKLTRYYHSCTLQLNARGIPVAYGDTLKLCAFYLENDTVGAAVLAEVPCTNHMVSARLNFAECRFPDGHTLNTMDGFFLPLSNGRILAAAVPGILVDTKKLLSVFETVPETPDNTSNQEETLPVNQEENSNHKEIVIPEISDTTPEHKETASSEIPDVTLNQDEPVLEIQDAAPNQNQTAFEEHTTIQFEEDPLPSIIDAEPDQKDIDSNTGSAARNGDTTPPNADSNAPNDDISISADSNAVTTHTDSSTENSNQKEAQETPQKKVRKIQRSDISSLPRHYWHLANNSFLLHGYHNYSHLLLVEEDGRHWLGVPGVYDSREARAARLFGFPQFTDSYNDELSLSEEEQNENGTFGYWCCFLK